MGTSATPFFPKNVIERYSGVFQPNGECYLRVGWIAVKHPHLLTAADMGHRAVVAGKYPPAEPGALFCEPLKAAERGR
jgi:hypothetical protein